MGEVLRATVYPIMVMGGLAIVFAIGLGIASRVFYVYVDPKVKAVEELLPGANCGGCGYAGCADCAAAIVVGDAPCTACVASSEETYTAIAKVLGKTVEVKEKEVAWIMCRGTKDKAKRRFQYMGIEDCRAAIVVAGGDKVCSYGCLGLGTCVRNCPFGALSMGEDGIPIVNKDKCTGCGTCTRVCPRGIPKLMPVSLKIAVFCSSHDPPPVVKKICEVGCQGCGLCKKACPEKAITIEGFLSVVDVDKCTLCGKCFEKCPTGAIQQILPA
jgi:Na+-translocating ferredoxin:NAD+ oxidoreductase RNF subunit RnfB